MRSRLTLSLIILFLPIHLCFAQKHPQQNSGLDSLVESERKFARASVERGIRDSFLEFFADDCISFAPEPALARQRILKHPAPPVRPNVTLNWEPVFADISIAGDMGYTTGPYMLTNEGAKPSSTSHGYYFSIWQKQGNGDWKVSLDIGVETPAPAPGKLTLWLPPQVRPYSSPAIVNVADEAKGLLRLEHEFYQIAATKGASTAYQLYIGTDVRLNRPHTLPIVGKDAVRAFLSKKALYLTGEPIRARVSTSGDLSFVYGAYEAKETPVELAVEKGYYVRVWKRGAGGNWRIVVDIVSLAS